MIYYEKLEEMVKNHFPDTKAFTSTYWLTALVNQYVSAQNKASQHLVALMMAAYISGVLVGEGHPEDVIASAMDEEMLKLEKEMNPMVRVTDEEEF